MSVHYKFKSALNSDTVTFDGLHISVGDLKKAIIHQKRLGKTVDFDLQITNAQTKEEYSDNNTLIPKNTSLIVARIPLAVQPKKQWDMQAEKQQQQQSHRHNNAPEPDGGALDLSQMNGTEEDKIQAMMIQSTMDYDPNNYQVIRGQSQVGEVPANYRCFKCRKPGHWIKNCPLSSNGEVNDFKRNTGIPRSFIERDAIDKNSAATVEPMSAPVVEKKQEIPDDLICAICKDLFTDAVMIPCCGSSFCDECVRTALLESEDNECPDCKEKGSSPGSLIPNRFLRNSVNAFKNETGYTKPRSQKPVSKPKEVEESVSAVVSTEESAEPITEKESPLERKSETKVSDIEPEKEPKPSKPASTVKVDPPAKEKKDDLESNEKKADPGHHSSHDEIESDFEDNITVTVPATHLISHQRSEYRDRPYNGRHSRHLRPPGMEGSPKNSSQNTPLRGDRSPPGEEKETSQHDHHKHHHQIPSHQAPHRGEQGRPHRSTPADMYGGGAPISSYPPSQGPMMGPGRPYEMGGYGPPPGPGYPPYMMDNRMRGPFHPMRPGYPQPHQMRPRMMAPPGSLASVYHGVAAKVGPGIIDDPLEAFNRIMREKEKRKEERRRGPVDNRRRSRSIELNPGRGSRGLSPPVHHGRGQRMRSPEDRRMRSPQMRVDRRGRSREKRSPQKEKRRHRSSSFSDRSRSRSRSRSWSNPPRKRSKSPEMRRRSRSRSPSFTMGRYRQKENRRPDRRDEFQHREEFRERSPGNYQPRRGRSPRRGHSPPQQHNQFYGRPDRQGHGGPPPDQYFNIPPGPPGPYNDGAPYGHNNSGNNRYPDRMPPHREQYGRDRNDYKIDRFEDGPPGNDEPPPPGFESSPPSPRERRNSWNNPFDDRERVGPYMRQDMRNKEQSGRNRGHTPVESREKQHSPMRERDDQRHHDGRERETRSWSRTSQQSLMNRGRRRSRSKTPVRVDKIPDDYPVHERVKDRRQDSRDHQMHDREKIEINEKKRDREERDRKHAEKEKKELERKQHEKELKRAAREEKEREKEREREKEKEKDREKSREKKPRDSSDDEKKDKKSKEKRKKKKEKEAEKKKKKEKKERKEREKEREKEKEKENSKKETTHESKPEESFESIENEQPCEPQNRVLHTTEAEIPDEKLFNPPPPAEEPNSGKEETDSNLEEGEIHDNDEDQVPSIKPKEHHQQHENEIIDLYGDICQDEEIKYDYSSSAAASDSANDSKNPPHSQELKRSSPPDFKRFDSVLDIHANLDFEPDLEEIEGADQKKESNPFSAVMPELSKWERDEDVLINKDELAQSGSPDESDEKTGKVTTEVLKRAENAIFARAINAIRPIEIKKISVERQKLYSNDPSKEISPTVSIMSQIKSPSRELATVQITVPAGNAERSVEIKPEKQKSIKDRLGSKITDPPIRRHQSKSQSPSRKSAVDKIRRSRSRDHETSFRRDDREMRRTSEIKRVHDASTNRGRDRTQPEFNRGREQGRNPDRVDRSDRLERQDRPERLDRIDRRREFAPQDRSGGNRIDRNDRERERTRQWDQERSREKERNRGDIVRERDRDRDRGDNEWNRSRDKSRETLNTKDDRKLSSRSDEGRSKEKTKSKESERGRLKDDKREDSGTRSSDHNRDKATKTDREQKRKHVDERARTPPEKKSKVERTKETERSDSRNGHERSRQRKKSTIDEASFVPDYDEQTDNAETHGKSADSSATTKQSTDKIKTPEASGRGGSASKRSRSPSESSSSSSSSSSDSGSDSDDAKKKKRSKHKKNKKKTRRSSSMESGESSSKHKRSKSKKKNKSSKKKKKNKK